MAAPELFDQSIDFDPQGDLKEQTAPIPAKQGVLFFSGVDDHPVLLLFAANMRQMARRRLQTPEDATGRRADIRQITRKLHYRRCYSPFETQLSYFRIGRALYPDHLTELFGSLKAWYLRLETHLAYPRFVRVERYEPEKGPHWGPFAEKRAAHKWLETLQDLFDLCRCPETLNQAPHATPCAYAQMGRCRVICSGRTSPDDYQTAIDQARDLLANPLDDTRRRWQETMKQLAHQQRYEQAAIQKRRLDLLAKLPTSPAMWLTEMSNFFVLSFQPGPVRIEQTAPDTESSTSKKPPPIKQPTIAVFLIGPGWVQPIEPLVVDEMESGYPALLDHIALQQMQRLQGAAQPVDQELLAWVTNYLYKKVQGKGLFVPITENTTADMLAERVRAYAATLALPVRGKTKKPKLDSASLAQGQTESEVHDDTQ